MSIEFFVVTDKEPERPDLSSNGGDYFFGRTIAIENGRPIAVRYWTSADFDYCPHRGAFTSCEHCHDETATEKEAEGYESGERISNLVLYGIALGRLNTGGFSRIAS